MNIQNYNSWRKIYALLLLLSIAFLVGSPLSAGPDEPEHQATAWYYSQNLAPVEVYHETVKGIPYQLVAKPCYATKPEVSAACLNQLSTSNHLTQEYKVNNYPQLPYWIIGAGQTIFGIIDSNLISLGGRVFLMLACYLLLMLSQNFLIKSGNSNYNFVIFIFCSPMVLFLSATANPNALEISAAMAYASSILYFQNAPSKRSLLYALILGLALSMSRPISFVWMMIILLFSVFLTSDKKRSKHDIYLLFSSTPGLAFGIYWKLAHPTFLDFPGYVPEVISNQYSYLLESFFKSLNLIPLRFEQSWGILGWLDTRPLEIIWFVIVAIWSWFLLSNLGTQILHMKLPIIGIASIFVFISLLEASANQHWPTWWQGRYQLPVLAGVVLLTLKYSGKSFGTAGVFLFYLTIFFNLYMVVLNFARYNWGVIEGTPVNLAINAFSAPRIMFFCFILCLSIIQVLRISRDETFKTNSQLWHSVS